MEYAITREADGNTALGKLRFATWREAMNYATTSNLDAPDRMTASYGVVALCPDERLDLLERLVAACNHDSDGLPGRVRDAFEALDA